MKKNPKKLLVPLPRDPTLRFSPTAWAKLLFLRDLGESEIGGFGIARPDDLLFVEDVQLVLQTSSWAHVAFDDGAVADFFDAQVDDGRRPDEFARLWIHTHPGSSPQPSPTDQETFARVFGRSDWAVMFILARGGQSYARLRFSVGPGASLLLPVEIDYSREFDGSDHQHWQEEYLASVRIPPPAPLKKSSGKRRRALPAAGDEEFLEDFWRDAWGEYTNFDYLPEETQDGFVRDF